MNDYSLCVPYVLAGRGHTGLTSSASTAASSTIGSNRRNRDATSGADVIDPGDRCMEHMCVGLRRQMVGMRGGRGGQSGVSGSGSKRAYPRGVPRYPFIPSLRPGNHRTCIRLVNKLKVSCLPTRDTMDSHLPSVVVYEHFLLVSIDI